MRSIVSQRVATFLDARGDDLLTFVHEARCGEYVCDACGEPLGDDELTIGVYVLPNAGPYRIVAAHGHHHRPSNVVAVSAAMWRQIAARPRHAAHDFAG